MSLSNLANLLSSLPTFSVRDYETKNIIHPKDWFVIEIINPNLETGPWIAGGSCLRWLEGKEILGTSHDIDVFFRDSKQFCELRDKIKNFSKDQEYTSVHVVTTKNAVTYKVYDKEDTSKVWNVQLICQHYTDIHDVFDHFDFRVCKISMDGNKWIAAPGALNDLKHKKITVDRFLPDKILSRIIKYYVYGYSLPENLVKDLISNTDVSKDFSNEFDYDI